MARIACEAELMFDYDKLYNDIRTYSPSPTTTAESMASACASAALSLNIDIIIVLTDTGRIVRFVAKYRPRQVILACSVSAHIVRQMNLSKRAKGFKVPLSRELICYFKSFLFHFHSPLTIKFYFFLIFSFVFG